MGKYFFIPKDKRGGVRCKDIGKLTKRRLQRKQKDSTNNGSVSKASDNNKRNEHVTACPNCAKSLIISQPKDHSEYTPAGTCNNCGYTFAMVGYLTGNRELSRI